MQIRFLLGPAGSGKTFRCVTESQAALRADPAGSPLLLLAPKQATFQLERQLLADPELGGYTRLQILSFERLAKFILDEFSPAPARLLSDEGRLMVVRALLARHQGELKLFRATARLPGFAQQLSHLLRELQQHQLGPQRLETLSAQVPLAPQLSEKLHDVGLILRAYGAWLEENQIQDVNCLLDCAAKAMRQVARESTLLLGGLWLDGFGELAPQEIDLLAALIPCCRQATLAFCLEGMPPENGSWLSPWSVVGQTFRRCYQALSSVPGAEVSVEVLERAAARQRFAGAPALRHLEESWSQPRPFAPGGAKAGGAAEQLSLEDQIFAGDLRESLRVVQCANPETEATLAAHEILRQVRERGGRYRDIAVLVRQWQGYHDALRRVFTRYEIPFFLDRRESLAHHPMAELTRSALRLVAFGWQHEDWFGVLKTGLVPAREEDIDDLENEALARGWHGKVWQAPLRIAGDEPRAKALERIRLKLVAPFLNWSEALVAARPASGDGPTGAGLAAALRQLWEALGVGETLRAWGEEPGAHTPHGSTLHTAVWEQMQEWLDNVALAFPNEALSLREWLPVLEAGLSSLTVGVVPPALDQVLIGAVDRSRNPDLQLAIVLGLNETVFPAPPATGDLLTESDRAELERQNVFLGWNTRHRLGQERFLGYIACTRARRRLVLSCSSYDARDRKLNPSPFLDHLQQLFPTMEIEDWRPPGPWIQSEHASDLVAPLFEAQQRAGDGVALAEAGTARSSLLTLAGLPVFGPFRERLRHFQPVRPDEPLSPALAGKLYGANLQTSVSRIEQFAACPFKFFVNSGLRAQERKRFEVDRRTVGDFQHQVLKLFHDELRADQKPWRALSPAEAREIIGRIAVDHAKVFGDGLLQANERDRFTARQLTAALQNFIEMIIAWMPQYQFDPAAVELRFHEVGDIPAWKLPLAGGLQLVFTGSIDRVDLLPNPDGTSALCVVVDYKSSARQIDRRLLENGVQLQLPAYLSVLRHLQDPARLFGVKELIPVGVFYVNLKGHYPRGANRREVFQEATEARRLAYRHTGRFDRRYLRNLDTRPEAVKGDQFNYALTQKGLIHGRCQEPLETAEFQEMLEVVERRLREMGEAIFRGEAGVNPYRQGSSTPCLYCDYRSVCRIDPWTHRYRVLREVAVQPEEAG